MSRRVGVYLHGTRTGELLERPDGLVEFRLSEGYLDQPDRPVLGQQFEDAPRKVFNGKKRSALPSFFANLLPEGRLRYYLEDHGGVEEGDDLALLVFLGFDLPGAATVAPLDEGEGDAFGDMADRQSESNANGNGALRFSLAGVHLKFSVVRGRKGLTMPAHGWGGEWIVKLAGSELHGVAENEFSMMQWASACGFEVPECELIRADALDPLPVEYVAPDSTAFLIKRFDRSPEGRVHQEDLAQVAGLWPELKYDHLTFDSMAEIVSAVCRVDEAEEFVRRLVLMVATGNADAHAKNWSFVYPDRIRPRLSPLYDQVFTGAWPTMLADATGKRRSIKHELALKLASVKQFARVDADTFGELASRVELDRSRVVNLARETVHQLAKRWAEIGGDLPLLPDHRKRLEQHWEAVPLLREHGPLT